MQAKDLVDYLLPRTKKLLVSSESDFKYKINNWLNTKGLIVRFVGLRMIDPIWKIVVGPLLPVIITIVVNISVGAFAPILIPFVPLIDSIISYLSDNVLHPDKKQQIKDIVDFISKYKVDKETESAINMQEFEAKSILLGQEYFNGQS